MSILTEFTRKCREIEASIESIFEKTPTSLNGLYSGMSKIYDDTDDPKERERRINQYLDRHVSFVCLPSK